MHDHTSSTLEDTKYTVYVESTSICMDAGAKLRQERLNFQNDTYDREINFKRSNSSPVVP